MNETRTLFSTLGWPSGKTCGALRWSRGGDEDGMAASMSIAPSGEVVMSSSLRYRGRLLPRFSAIVAPGEHAARVSMPGVEAAAMPLPQAISLFKAHVAALEDPEFVGDTPLPSKPAPRL